MSKPKLTIKRALDGSMFVFDENNHCIAHFSVVDPKLRRKV